MRRVPHPPRSGRARRRVFRLPATFATLGVLVSACASGSGPVRPVVAVRHMPSWAAIPCPARVRQAVVTSVTADAGLDRAWRSYVRSNVGWTGGDSVYAYSAPDVGTLWTFSDSMVGGILAGNHRERGIIYHNLFVTQDRSGFHLVYSGTSQQRSSMVNAAYGKDFYLALGGIVEGPVFQAIFMERLQTGHFSLDNVPIGSIIATFSVPGFRLLRVAAVPASSPKVQWGAYVSRLGSFTYVYGASSGGLVKQGYVARARGTDLQGTWSYWDGHGWSPSSADAAPIISDIQQEYSVTTFDGMYVLVSSDSSAAFSSAADVYLSCSPVGPFRRIKQFALSYLVGYDGTRHWGDPAVYVYDALLQPALTTGDKLVVSYNQNSLNFDAIYADVDIYQPSYLDITIGIGRRS